MNDGPGFWFADLDRSLEVAAGGVLLFAFAVLLGRLLGKRSMAKMNNFDWLIAVASGSILASGVLARDIGLASAAVAMATLGVCQFVVTKFFAHQPKMVEELKADPTLLLHKGQFIREAMEKTRVSKDEIFSALRNAGMTDPAAAQWVVMEPDGQLNVIARQKDLAIGDSSIMAGVNYDPASIDRIEREQAEELAESERRYARE